MVRRELHIITVGNSLIANYQKITENEKIKESKMGDEIWKKLLNDRNFLSEIYKFLEKDPAKNSAEINSLFKYCNGKKKILKTLKFILQEQKPIQMKSH